MALGDQIRVMREAGLLDDDALNYWKEHTSFPYRLEPCCVATEVFWTDDRVVCQWWREQLKDQPRRQDLSFESPDPHRRPYFFQDGRRPTEEEKKEIKEWNDKKRAQRMEQEVEST